jgi:hypothetical protein
MMGCTTEIGNRHSVCTLWSPPSLMCPNAPVTIFRRHNTITRPERYLLLSILDLFSCDDFVKGYHQIPKAAEHRKIVIIMPFSLLNICLCR